MQQPETIITEDSPEAARAHTMTGWLSRSGHFYYGAGAETAARWDGATHRKCDECGALYPKSRPYICCDDCREKHAAARWQAMPEAEWDGKAMLYSEVADVWFSDEQELADHCAENETTPDALRLIIGRPEFPREIDGADLLADSLPEDGDLPAELEEAFDKLNEAIRAYNTNAQPLSWLVGKTRPTSASVAIEDNADAE